MINSDILKDFQNKQCLVTGGTGLIGRQVVDILVAAEAKVRVVSLDNLNLNASVEYIKKDLCDFSVCKDLTADCDYVFHIAGAKGSIVVTKQQPASFLVPIMMMNTNVLEACRVNQVDKIVYTSSIGAYASSDIFVEGENEEGPPMDEYPGWAKRMAEKQIKAYEIQYGLKNFAIVRPANVYGPGDNFDPKNAMVVSSLMARIKSGENPLKVWGDGSAIRDLAYSYDVAEGIVLALYHGTSGYVNLGSGEGYSIRTLVETLAEFLDFEYEFDDTKDSGFPKRVMDISKARSQLGYDPQTTLLEGLKHTWDWFSSNEKTHLKRQNYFLKENGNV